MKQTSSFFDSGIAFINFIACDCSLMQALRFSLVFVRFEEHRMNCKTILHDLILFLVSAINLISYSFAIYA